MPDTITTVRTVGGEASTAFLAARNIRQRARMKRLRVAIFILRMRRLR